MRILFVAVALLVVATSRVDAAQSVVQAANCFSSAANDVECSLGSATTAGNKVIILALVSANDQTISITGTSMSFSATSNSPVTGTLTAILNRMYIFCAEADGDNTFTLTSSGTGTTQGAIVEATETSCTADVVGSGEANGTTLSADLTTTVPNTLVVMLGRVGSSRTFTVGSGYTSIAPASNFTMGEYKLVTGSAGAQTVNMTISSSTNWFAISAAFPEDTEEEPEPAVTPSIAEVTTASGEDPTATFDVAPGEDDVVVCFVAINSRTETVSMSGFQEIDNAAHASQAVRTYAFWRIGDGMTDAFQATSGATSVIVVCASLDDADTDSPVHVYGTGETSPQGTAHSVSGGLTTTVDNTLILAFIRVASSPATFTNGSGYSDLVANGTFMSAHGQQQDAESAGNYDVAWTTSANEDTAFVAVAIAPVGGGTSEPPGTVRCCGGLMRGILP